MTTPAPRMLGRYELLEALGQGGMGEVWLAKLTGAAGFEKPCIVKTVLPALAKDPSFVSRFQHEAKVLVHLNHPAIAQVYDMGESEGALFMALEYVPGVDLGTLGQQLKAQGERVPLPVALYLGWHAAEGLAAAHAKRAPDGTPLEVVHRDVSPQNVMASFEGDVKVIDFGIARSAGRAQSTQQAMVMGKLGYMAPEQARAEPLDARADQYALGLVLWELLTGEPYVPQGTVAEMLAAMTSGARPQPLQGRHPEVDATTEAVLLRALEPNRDERWPTTEAFARALLQDATRLRGPASRGQIAQWLRARCATQFAANQKLLSRITTLKPIATEVSPMNDPRPLNTNEAIAAMRRPMWPFTVLGAVIVMLGGALVWALVLRPPPPPTPQVAPPTPPAPLARQPGAIDLDRPMKTNTPNPGDALQPAPTPAPEPSPPPSIPGLPERPNPLGTKREFGAVDAPPVDTGPGGPASPHLKKPPAGLQGKLRLQESPQRSVFLTNVGGTTWSSCTVTIPGQKQLPVKRIAPGFTLELPLVNFVAAPNAPVLTDAVKIDCPQGSLTLPAK